VTKKHIKRYLVLLFLIFSGSIVNAQNGAKPEDTEVWKPVPKVVTLDDNGVPSDAIILFDGKKTKELVHQGGEPLAWEVKNNVMTVTRTGLKAVKTVREFGDCQLHIEFRCPIRKGAKGQKYGNSGIFLQSRYEIQVLNSYKNKTYSNGQCASIYKQSAPLVNVSKPPMEWQVYDIVYKAPKWDDDNKLISEAYITVLHNGVLVQNNVKILGRTRYIGKAKYEKPHKKAPISLQDHGNPVSYRNIWVREL